MAIYRGAGGAGDAVADSSSEALLVRDLATQVTADAAAAEAAKVAAIAAKVAAETAETNAETAETNAETAETNAETAQAAAASSASASSASATNSATSATSSANSASAASTSATNAAASASNAASSATASAGSASSAATSLLAVQQVFDDFDDVYLGAKSSDPTVDNDGDPLVAGAVYFNTTAEEVRFYNGTAWERPEYAASQSALAAQNSATAASTSASNASTSASNAAASASTATSAASTATTQAGLASASATAAQTAETNAETAETNATASASLANDWATKTSAPVAGGEYSSKYNAQLAATSATNASNSASSASTSATNASNSASAAATSETNAAASATTAASYVPSVTGNSGKFLTNNGTTLNWGTVTGGVTSVTGTAPVVSSGGATPAISMAAATTSVSGYLTSTDWTTFNGKYSTGGALGTPSSGTLTNCTGYTYANLSGTVPTWNQSTTGNAATATTATTANALNTANAYTVNSLTVSSTAPRLFFADTNGTTFSLYNDTNVFYLLNSGGGNLLTCDTSGNFTATANVTAYSDERLKKNWRPVQDNFVEKLAKVKSGIYDRTDIEATQAGVSAQDMQKILPESVLDGEHLSLAYGNAALVAAIELAKQVVELRKEIELLKAK
jgi:hypothetical protein